MKNKKLIFAIVVAIFILQLLLRINNIELKNPFGYDQVDNAWAAKNLIVNNKYPLVGMVAKTNSGVYIGPAYYYVVSFFYWIFNLNPFASIAISLITSFFTFWIVFYILKKLFPLEISVIATIINSFNFKTLIFEGIQWPVQMLPAVSLIIFYLLYKVITGDVKKIMLLAVFLGFSFNLHFTAIFLLIAILLSFPLFPKNKKTLKYILFSIPVFLIWLVPNIIYFYINKSADSTAVSYFSSYYHGFHLTRMMQIAGDALIQFDPYLVLDNIKPFKFLIIFVFFIFYFLRNKTSDRIKFLYLIFLWFSVPWLVFTIYSGEISDYYFAINRFLTLIIISYLVYLIWSIKYKIAKIFIILFLIVYSFYGISQFFPYRDEGNFAIREKKTREAIDAKKRIEFQVGVPESYYYYYLMKKEKGVEVY